MPDETFEGSLEMKERYWISLGVDLGSERSNFAGLSAVDED